MERFIKNKPNIPDKVRQALNRNELVLFCGAGISVENGLPEFKDLVKKVCKELNLEDDQYIKKTIEKEEYDLALDLIGEKISSVTLRKKVINILSCTKENYDIHKSLLDLSALYDNKGHRLVTTNFDKLFFKAGLNKSQADSAPKIIIPRKEDWNHVTFLHGVIDKKNDPEGKHLILTKTDFSKAYLYDGWATKFTFQLFREFKVLFIGYSITDPIMSYLISAIKYEKSREKTNLKNNTLNTAYAFVGYNDEKDKEEKQREWHIRGVTPIMYKITKDNGHSLLYDTIKAWANQKKQGLEGEKSRLREIVKNPYNPLEKERANFVISSLKTNKKLAEYFSEIHPVVDISWLIPFSEQKPVNLEENSINPQQEIQTYSHLDNLVKKHDIDQQISLWKPLNNFEMSVIKWLGYYHLDKKEFIHWVIKQGCMLHPTFNASIEDYIKHIQNNKLPNRILYFWKTVVNQNNTVINQNNRNVFIPRVSNLIRALNNIYCPITAQHLIQELEPYIEFKTEYYPLPEEKGDQIYDATLKININQYVNNQLTNEEALLKHAEDFTDLLIKAMKKISLFKTIVFIEDLLLTVRPDIESYRQNRYDYSWILLIDLVIGSFDIVIQKDKKLAYRLLEKWQVYPCSLFYRLILYVVRKYPDIDENLAINLFKETKKALWLRACQNEVFKYLRNRPHSNQIKDHLVSLIIEGPPDDLFNKNLDKKTLEEYKNKDIYFRLQCLKSGKNTLSEDTISIFNQIEKKYNLQNNTKGISDEFDYLYFHTDFYRIKDDTRYHQQTKEQIYKDLNQASKRDNHIYIYGDPKKAQIDNDKLDRFSQLSKDIPKKAFDTLLLFNEDNIKRSICWRGFINGVNMIENSTIKEEWFLKALDKIKSFKDDFFKDNLYAFTSSVNMLAVPVYKKYNGNFYLFWNRLWGLSKEKEKKFNNKSIDIPMDATNSNLGKLSEAILYILWHQVVDDNDKIQRDRKIPQEIKKYLKIIIETGQQNNFYIFFHFGRSLFNLWFLDRVWVLDKISPLMKWKDKLVSKAIWVGYFYNTKVNPSLILDFKNELFDLFSNKQLFKKNDKNDYENYYNSIADLFLISTGGKWSDSIFNQEEEKKLKYYIKDTNLLKDLAVEIKALLKDGENKSAVLWSKKIQPWIKKFWPKEREMQSDQTAIYFSYAVLYCGDQLPSAFNDLKGYIHGYIKDIKTPNTLCLGSKHIVYEINELNKQNPNYINKNAKELLCLLCWNYPEENISYDNELQKLLNSIVSAKPELKQTKEYRELEEKCST